MNQRHFGGKLSSSFYYAVPDPDLEIRGEGGGRWSPQNFSLTLQASVWSKNKGGPPLDLSLLQILRKNVLVVETSYQNVWQKM